MTLISAHCPTCRAPRDVTRNAPSHGSIDAAMLACGHFIVIDHGTIYADVSETQWDVALAQISAGSYLRMMDTDGGRNPGFNTLCRVARKAGIR